MYSFPSPLSPTCKAPAEARVTSAVRPCRAAAGTAAAFLKLHGVVCLWQVYFYWYCWFGSYGMNSCRISKERTPQLPQPSNESEVNRQIAFAFSSTCKLWQTPTLQQVLRRGPRVTYSTDASPVFTWERALWTPRLRAPCTAPALPRLRSWSSAGQPRSRSRSRTRGPGACRGRGVRGFPTRREAGEASLLSGRGPQPCHAGRGF